MSKGILEFALPEETEEFELACKGAEYSYALHELDNWLRGLAKYTDQKTVTIEEVRQKIRDLTPE